MFWKVCALAVVLLGGFGLSVAPAEQSTAREPEDVIAPIETVPTAVAKAPTDQELIEKQKTCPVMNKPLGSMGKPVKVVVKGRTVFLCCAGCKKKLFADPDKYLKKLDGQQSAR
jgi:hypothetical protein